VSLSKIHLEYFTAFKKIDLSLSPGINVFIGANGTGKTHLMKVAYAACDVSKTKIDFAEKLIRVFLPSRRALGRLVKRQKGSTDCRVEIQRENSKLSMRFSNHALISYDAKTSGISNWNNSPVNCVFIPVKEMLSNAPGFRALYNQREIHFEEVYADIIDRASLPILRGPIDQSRKNLLNILQKKIAGRVIVEQEEFFLRNQQGNLEFSLLAEGMRKLALLWLLIQNGTLLNGSILFWDEPETNLNPKLFGTLIEILLELQRIGVQIFLATHDYVILKELDLQKKPADKIVFHSLFNDPNTNEICVETASDYLQIHPNTIAQVFNELYDREIQRSLSKNT
jgi:ABC-type ATPase involved in cell division